MAQSKGGGSTVSKMRQHPFLIRTAPPETTPKSLRREKHIFCERDKAAPKIAAPVYLQRRYKSTPLLSSQREKAQRC